MRPQAKSRWCQISVFSYPEPWRWIPTIPVESVCEISYRSPRSKNLSDCPSWSELPSAFLLECWLNPTEWSSKSHSKPDCFMSVDSTTDLQWDESVSTHPGDQSFYRNSPIERSELIHPHLAIYNALWGNTWSKSGDPIWDWSRREAEIWQNSPNLWNSMFSLSIVSCTHPEMPLSTRSALETVPNSPEVCPEYSRVIHTSPAILSNRFRVAFFRMKS